MVAMDCETTGLTYKVDTLVDIVIAVSEYEAYLIPANLVGYLNPVKNCTIIFHNAKFDLKMLYNAGLDLTECDWKDTVIYDHLNDENVSHSLDDIVKRMYNDDYKEKFWAKYKTYEEASEEDKLEYTCKDATYTFRYYQFIRNSVGTGIVSHVHLLARALLATELMGVSIDKRLVIDTGLGLQNQYQTLLNNMRSSVSKEVDIWEISNWTKELSERKTERGKANVKRPVFNFESNKQLGELLYDLIGLPEQKSKLRKRTVDDAALEVLKDEHPIISDIRSMRENRKLYGTYVEGLLEREIDSRIYPEFNVCGTVTGRISSKNPNLQNIPREGVMRNFFIPDEGMVFLDADYGQLEVCIAAHFSQDKNLLAIVFDNASKHDITAQALGIDRYAAKTLNFAMQYQCSAKKVASLLKCSLQEAEVIWNKYWATYVGEKKVIDECKRKVDKGVPIVNAFGRHRRFPTRYNNIWEKEAAYRQAYSSLIQGTGGDICNKAYIDIHAWLKSTKYGHTMWPVHDEILIACYKDYIVECKDKLVDTMVSVGRDIKLTVPLKVECKGPLHKWEK